MNLKSYVLIEKALISVGFLLFYHNKKRHPKAVSRR